ncbi:hypothetical protein SSX86_025652 [Deinandra increscens subsp. villosa]|uniref:DUF7950 domain-containing protein n=1 Tax=Deinandra increscens subsp. villosa TaxID=3103831 RepID=A0AAP0CGN3_9ASTR
MNGKSGYCVARYAGGGGIYGMSKVDSIMLKFRPIAPKPIPAGSGWGGGSMTGKSGGYVSCGRSKRKYVRVNKNRKRKESSKRTEKTKVEVEAHPPSSSPPVVTLSLLPETPDPKKNEPTGSFSDLLLSSSPVQTTTTKWLSFDGRNPAPVRRPPHVVSNVTVECVTDTWVDLEQLGCTDEERLMNMEKDTCPGFISDGQDRVVWTNKAYREMSGLGVDGVNGDDDMAVVLVRKDKWTAPSPPVAYPAFTCKVKVTSAAAQSDRQSPNSPSSPTLTLPCDVWRMERGACAWRLDVKAALSLGR